MRYCLHLLKPDGMMMVQTPCYPESLSFEQMTALHHPFLQQLKADEHLFLLGSDALQRLFHSIGAAEVRQEPAMFPHYDQFVVVSKSPLVMRNPELQPMEPSQRLVQAMLDLQIRSSETEHRLHEAESDRAARLCVIEEQGRRLGNLEAERNSLHAELQGLQQHLAAAEKDRGARLAVIEEQGLRLGNLEAERNNLQAELQALQQHLAVAEEDRAARLRVIEEQGNRLAILEGELNHLHAELQSLQARFAVAEERSRSAPGQKQKNQLSQMGRGTE